jgi:dihydroorotase
LNNQDYTVQPPPEWRALSADKLAIKGARLFDPALGLDLRADLVIEGGKIKSIGPIPAGWSGEVVEASGWTICPGLFDMHVHLREPGFEHKETVRSGCRAAAGGGFTGVAPMPNTEPPIDNPGLVKFLRERAEDLPVEVHPVAAVSRGRKGEELAEISELIEAGVSGFSDDGAPVGSSELMRRALEYTRMGGAVVIEHCEDRALTADGVMHEGAVATRLGLPGWPSIGEEIAVERNIRLAEYTGGRLHIAHVSTAGSAELIRAAKARGVKVTAEVTPQHLTLDCELLTSFSTDYKVNPPLRTAEDLKALVEALADGTIDAIATDHAPHAPDEKDVEFIQAPFGMIGLETALGVILTKLVNTGKIPLARAMEALTAAPRRILNLPPVKIETGQPANLTLFDPVETWTVDRERMVSKSRNTPFNGWKLTGRATGVINRGQAWIRVR